LLSILAPRRRVDQALYAVIMEASNRLLIDSTDSLQEIEARITSRDFEAVHHPERGPTVRKVLKELLAVLDANSPDGVILSAWFPALLWAPAGFSPGGWGVAESGRCRRPVSTPCPLNSPRCTGLPGGACDGPPRRPAPASFAPIRGVTDTEGSQTMPQDTKATTFDPKFQLGQIVATPGAICTEDKAPNDQALV
jgi:hypothetical protein